LAVQERNVIPLLAFLGVLAAIWGIYKYQTVYSTLISSFPLEFQGAEISRHAFPVIALDTSTPLKLQWDYVTSQVGLCFAAFCFWLCWFFTDQVLARWLFSIVFLAAVASTIKSWMTYKANRKRRLAIDEKKQR
jgi:hypothetical protein